MFKSKLEDFIYNPQRQNDSDFCKRYKELSEIYWSLADETIINALDGACEALIQDFYTGKDLGMYNGKTPDEIKRIFNAKKLLIFEKISPALADRIQKKLDDLLRKNKVSAKNCKLVIPDYGKHLSTREYYLNYLLAIEMLKHLEIILMKK